MTGIRFNKVLITGGAGFIGSHLADALVTISEEVRVLDNLSTGNLSNLEHLKDRISFFNGDIRDTDFLRMVSESCDAVFHLAAIVSVPLTVEKPLESAYVNDIGTLKVLEAARQNRVKRVIISSSSAVYGDESGVPNQETMPPKPISPYAIQKYTGELYADIYNRLYRVPVVSLRYFNVFGPRQNPSSPYSGVISIFMTKAAANSRPIIYGDGNQRRDFVFVKDVVKANLLAAASENAGANVFNIGTGKSVSINELWRHVSAIAGISAEPEYRPPRKGDILESAADITRAGKQLGFEPDYSFEDGLKLTYDWYRSSSK